ncbi:MAG: DUF3597 domain-containing protein [Gammaproteobacteria bacterium]|nr:DUF3597 domain-containing protein [Gammaproteobacteria bacterium]
MGLLTKILEKLGLGTAHAATPDIRATGKKPGITGTATAPPPPRVVTPAAVPAVDVVAQLEKRAAANSQKLNWKTSIVDLLKLLDIDSGLDDRKALAKELGCPADLMDDSAKMNIWLHKEVLARIAANGGNVPANLLD